MKPLRWAVVLGVDHWVLGVVVGVLGWDQTKGLGWRWPPAAGRALTSGVCPVHAISLNKVGAPIVYAYLWRGALSNDRLDKRPSGADRPPVSRYQFDQLTTEPSWWSQMLYLLFPRGLKQLPPVPSAACGRGRRGPSNIDSPTIGTIAFWWIGPSRPARGDHPGRQRPTKDLSDHPRPTHHITCPSIQPSPPVRPHGGSSLTLVSRPASRAPLAPPRGCLWGEKSSVLGRLKATMDGSLKTTHTSRSVSTIISHLYCNQFTGITTCTCTADTVFLLDLYTVATWLRVFSFYPFMPFT